MSQFTNTFAIINLSLVFIGPKSHKNPYIVFEVHVTVNYVYM